MATKLNSISDVDRMVSDLSELREISKRTQAAIDEGKAAIEAYLESAQLSAFETEKSKVKLSKGKKRRFNRQKFKDEHPKQYEKYVEDEDYCQLYFAVR